MTVGPIGLVMKLSTWKSESPSLFAQATVSGITTRSSTSASIAASAMPAAGPTALES